MQRYALRSTDRGLVTGLRCNLEYYRNDPDTLPGTWASAGGDKGAVAPPENQKLKQITWKIQNE